MEYRKFDNVIVARIDKDEEILEQLRVIAIKENIKLASVQALGAINDFTVGVYKTDEKKYYSNSFQGYYEITSLTGTLGTKFWSGVGGQIDFVYGASLSKGGKAIIAMPSITNKGVSKICPTLLDGAGVVTTRNHIHWFVTEFGAVDLYGKTLQERARLLISIAHPSAQEELDRAAFERWGSHHHYIKGYMK